MSVYRNPASKIWNFRAFSLPFRNILCYQNATSSPYFFLPITLLISRKKCGLFLHFVPLDHYNFTVHHWEKPSSLPHVQNFAAGLPDTTSLLSFKDVDWPLVPWRRSLKSFSSPIKPVHLPVLFRHHTLWTVCRTAWENFALKAFPPGVLWQALRQRVYGAFQQEHRRDF